MRDRRTSQITGDLQGIIFLQGPQNLYNHISNPTERQDYLVNHIRSTEYVFRSTECVYRSDKIGANRDKQLRVVYLEEEKVEGR